jgi:cytoskeletal protein CcmA (bactofilin family)
VYGTVKGNVHGKGKIEIKKDGSVNGDLTTAQIIIEDGAYFKGSIAIEKSAASQTEITQDAISKAERITGKIDARWSGDKVPGKL